uniref:Uncharacterized protein n=1 Tax=Arundo donax TaxID=35708 RepID=A0A0A9H9D2_ARUDO
MKTTTFSFIQQAKRMNYHVQTSPIIVITQ